MAGSPSSGGVARGPGDAPLRYGEENPLQRELFESRALTPAELADPAALGLLGVGQAAPEAAAEHSASSGAGFEAGLGASPWRRRLAPRHRRAVRELLTPAASPSSPSSASTPPPASNGEDDR